MQKRLSAIAVELKAHAPFTLFGAATGVLCMLIFKGLAHDTSKVIFYVFHPAHVLLSALVTAAMFKLHSVKRSFAVILVVAIVGSIGVATLSDSLIPYAGEMLLGMKVHVHGHAGEDEHGHQADEPKQGTGFVKNAHIGFVEAWYVVFPAAIIGTLIACFRPRTKFPHAGHVLLSTWASSFHMVMAFGGNISLGRLVGSFVFLFLAVWLPCCFSDIVFPLLFAHSPDGLCCCHGGHKEAEQ
ncbi:MAG: hypothetical protein JXN61_01785 [Sedimentisphaerales bacterium]|nr:hypothetical protein [Sedimentisphaerales bacterium]